MIVEFEHFPVVFFEQVEVRAGNNSLISIAEMNVISERAAEKLSRIELTRIDKNSTRELVKLTDEITTQTLEAIVTQPRRVEEKRAERGQVVVVEPTVRLLAVNPLIHYHRRYGVGVKTVGDQIEVEQIRCDKHGRSVQIRADRCLADEQAIEVAN